MIEVDGCMIDPGEIAAVTAIAGSKAGRTGETFRFEIHLKGNPHPFAMTRTARTGSAIGHEFTARQAEDELQVVRNRLLAAPARLSRPSSSETVSMPR